MVVVVFTPSAYTQFLFHVLQPVEKLTKYISYARNTCHPVLGEDAARRLIDCYVELRKQGEDRSSSEKRVTATTRQLESMIRMSEAHARMRYIHHSYLLM